MYVNICYRKMHRCPVSSISTYYTYLMMSLNNCAFILELSMDANMYNIELNIYNS